MIRAAGRSAELAGTGALARLEDLVQLTKPRVVPLIVLTTAAGFYMGSAGAPVDVARLLLTLAGTALVAGGALGLNQVLEQDIDARMARTVDRPLPAGRLGPPEALAFCVALVTLGLAVHTLLVGAVAGLVTAVTVASYLFAYTPLKRTTALCTVVGAFPGALPPVTGWAAATGELGPGAWALFGILFFWQLPHALAIARLYRDEYAAAGVRLLPVVDRGGATARQVALNSLALLVVGMAPALVGIAGPVYLLASLALGLVQLGIAALLLWRDDARTARLLLAFSLVYLPVLLGVMALDRAPGRIGLP